jgi:hypothetical protein
MLEPLQFKYRMGLVKLFEVRPVFRRLQIGLFLFLGLIFAFAFKDDLLRMLRGNVHKEVIVKTMLPWGDDSRTCQLFNGSPAISGEPRTMQEGDHLQMLCPTGNIEGDWRLTYVGTVKLDDASERDFHSQDKYFVPLFCTKNGKTFECIKQN